MQNDAPIPVTLYQSTDANAPQLSAALGSLKTVLKACLVTGYDDKAALGWKMLFENDTNAVFQSSSPKASPAALLVDNSKAKFATLQPYTAMSQINVGTGFFGYGTQTDKFAYLNNKTEPRWWLIGHAAAFVFLVKLEHTEGSMMFYFGDVPTFNTNHSAFYVSNSYSAEYAYNQSRIGNYWQRSGNGGLLSQSVVLGKSSAITWITSSTDNDSYRPAYPDQVSGGLFADNIYIVERANMYQIAAKWAGFMAVLNDVNGVQEGKAMPIEGDDDVWLKFSSHSAQAFLINATRW